MLLRNNFLNIITDKINKFLHLVLPGGLIRLIFYFCRKIISSRQCFLYKETLQKNIILKNQGRGKRCFIIGNGPSLNKQDLSLLRNEITFVTNSFWQHPICSKKWQPTYYCLADRIFFDMNYFDINASLISGCKTIKEFYSIINEKIPKSIFLVPYCAREVIENYRFLPKDKVHYLLFNDYLYEGKKSGIDLCKVLPHAQSVSQMALQAAIYMGFNNVYLLGMDHNWLPRSDEQIHFYKDNNRGINKYFQKIDYVLSYKEDLKACLKLWQKYEDLLYIATDKGIKIINATKGGFLDVFPRVDYESLF